MSWFKSKPNRNPWSGQKWEYMYVKSLDAYTQDLNELGQQGWELVAVSQIWESARGYAYFKRPII